LISLFLLLVSLYILETTFETGILINGNASELFRFESIIEGNNIFPDYFQNYLANNTFTDET